MLAQLEVMEGNRETALGMARESVRLLEGIGNAKVTMAREILAKIETFDAGGPAEAPPFLAELDELKESDRLYAEAMAKARAGDMAGA